jgi:hypothetical protein
MGNLLSWFSRAQPTLPTAHSDDPAVNKLAFGAWTNEEDIAVFRAIVEADRK